MRLLLTTDTVGGVWSYTRELVEGLLLHADVSISLLSLGGLPSVDQGRWLDRMRDVYGDRLRSTSTDLPLEWQGDNARAYSAVEPLLLQEIDSFDPDIFHSNQFCFGALPAEVPKVIVAHSDVLSWHRAVRGEAAADSVWVRDYRRLVGAGLAGADVIVAPTAAMLGHLQADFGEQPKAHVIANGCSFAVPAPRVRKMQAVTAGRLWDEAKNIVMLGDVRSPMSLLVAGPSEHDGVHLQEGAMGRVQLLDELSHGAMLELFAESAIYVAPSVYEPFGLAALEAAMCGCAVVANDIASLREVWGEGALYFSGTEQLSGLLEVLARDTKALDAAQRRSMARAAIYTRERMTDAYLELYRELMEQAEGFSTEMRRA